MSDAPDSAQSATKRKARGKSQGRKPRHQDTTAGTLAPVLDDETAAALTLYNTYLVADREQQAHERALKKAEKAKDDAAAAVRKLNDRKAPAAETAEAETRYREAAEALQRLRGGDTAAPDAEDDNTEDDTAESAAEDAAGDEDTAGELPDSAAPEDAASEDTPTEDTQDTAGEQAEDTATENTDDAANEDTPPEDTATEDTQDTAGEQAEDTATENTDDAANEDTPPEDTASEDTASEDTATEDTAGEQAADTTS